MPGALALAIDVGSSAVRAAAVDPLGVLVSTARVERPDSHSGLVFDPQLLWSQVVTVCASLAADARAGIGTIAIAGHIGTVFLDERLQPIGPGRGWADTDGVPLLEAALGARSGELLRSAGRPSITGGAGAAALQFRSERPEEFARVRAIVSPKDFLVARLTGEVATDHTSAAYTGLARVAERGWDAGLLEATRLDAALFPGQLPSTSVVGVLGAAVSAELGLPSGTPVVSGGPDGTVGATFVIGERSDLIADVAGTTDVLVGLVGDPEAAPAEAMVNPYPLGGFSAGGATGMTGGALARWAALLGFGDSGTAVAALEGRAPLRPGAGGLRLVPTLSGARFPRWRPHETGRLRGQRAEHEAADIVQAAVEGAAFVVREGVDVLDPAREASIALAGGAARSRLLAQLRADILGRPVVLCGEPDVSLMGAALIAFRGIGAETSGEFDVGVRSPGVVAPDPERVEAYRAVYSDWQVD
ncbi:FGGY-family carbohydrate kinase [Leifsonia sp. C5G2]|uniref:xylulokinase n=1 Tax=Leifsonia sp. C5G2 TaxID=2735269 RepID=UPI001584869E|nr:FGGY-family carbohydrate kinase [Leifsonia sp. C5G2]NUU08454.1 FGGY-family carbohydrate kinase [Leifsonia sp. C5G2]